MTAQTRDIAITGFIISAIIAMWPWNHETHNGHAGASISTHLKGPEVEATRGASIIYATPIAFYGSVIDQHGDPVPDADVHFYVQDGFEDSPPIKGVTDQDGNFSITQIHGIALGVGVSKPGYRQLPPQDDKVTSSGLFEYHLATGPPSASRKDTPAVFTLQKVGILEPLTRIYRTINLDGTGKPFELSLDKNGGHKVAMKLVNRMYELPEGERLKYTWNFEVQALNGGLMKRENAFIFEAPEAGYKPSDFLDRPASMPFGYGGWASLETLSYFIHFHDGTFARATMDVHACGKNYVTWESFYNPQVGSRHLESAATGP